MNYFWIQCEQVVFLTDALSVLQALENDKLPHLTSALQLVGRNRRVVLEWVPARCGVPGNERADELTKIGAQEDQPNSRISLNEMRIIIRSLQRPPTERDNYHLLSREQQVILLRLRTGYNRLNAHMSRKFRLVPSPTCRCGLEDQTTEHILQRCPLYQGERQQTWPTATPLRTQLYGRREELAKTTAFITRCGMTV